MSNSEENKMEEILNEFLSLLQTSNCNEFTLLSSASNLNISQGELNIIAPKGLKSVLEALLNKHIKELITEIQNNNTNGITEGVKQSILTSFTLFEPYKTQLRKIFKYLLNPLNIPTAIKFNFQISSAIWKALNVNDHSFSYYSKRVILAKIYSNCFLYFICSKNHSKLELIISKQLSLLFKITSFFKKS